MIAPAYTYEASVVQIHDGDTITVDISVGFHIWMRSQKIRFLGINAPELGLPDLSGEKSRDALTGVLQTSRMEVVITTHKDSKEKFGRWLGIVFALDSKGQQFNVNDWMISNKWAVPMIET